MVAARQYVVRHTFTSTIVKCKVFATEQGTFISGSDIIPIRCDASLQLKKPKFKQILLLTTTKLLMPPPHHFGIVDPALLQIQ